MRILLKNARLLTMEEPVCVTEGALLVNDNLIESIGTIPESVKADRVIDCEKNLLMPGLKNAHTHSSMTFLRSFADDLALDEWLNTKIFPNEAKLNSDMIYWFNKLAVLEYLEGGITADFDMYIDPEAVIESSLECGFRNVQCGSLNDFTLTPSRMEALYKKYNNYNSLISYRLGVHAEYTCSRELLEKVADMANALKAPVFLHSQETKKEVEACKSRYNMTPTVLLDHMGMYNYGGGGFHCVYMEDEDIEIYKKRKLSIITNPGSNAKLASGIAPLKKYQDAGINIAIGTDGPASNNALDMFREMYLAAVLSKLSENDPVAIKAENVLKMATVNGARAMGLDKCDTLSVGKYADIIMIDLQRPNLWLQNNNISDLVYSAGKQNVIMTMIDGKILYYKGEYNIGLEPEVIYEKCNKYKKQILL